MMTQLDTITIEDLCQRARAKGLAAIATKPPPDRAAL
jgi:hypothetical protein